MQKEIKKYKGRNLIYKSLQTYGGSGDEYRFLCRTWKYNDENLLKKHTLESYYNQNSNYKEYEEEIFFYNNQNQVIRKEYNFPDEYYKESYYSIYSYSENNLFLIVNSYNNDELMGYIKIENTCN